MDIKKTPFFIESLLLFVLLIVFGGAVGSVFSGHINLIDEGQFGSWVYQMLQGKKLYSDIYSTYGPLYIYPLSFLFSFLGGDPFIVRIYLLLGSFIGGLMCLYVSYLVRLKRVLRIVLIGMIGLLPIVTLRQGLGIFAIALLVTAYQQNKMSLAFFAGVVLMISFLVSPEVAIFAFITLCIFSMARFVMGKKILADLRIAFVCLIGAVLTALFFGAFALAEGILTDYVLVTLDVFQSFSGVNVPNGQNFPHFSKIIFENPNFLNFVKSITSQEAMLYWSLIMYLFSLCYLFYKMVIQKIDRTDTWIFVLLLFGLQLYTVLLSRSGIGHFYFTFIPQILILGVFSQKLYARLTTKYFTERIIAVSILSLSFVFCLRLFMIYRFETQQTFFDFASYFSRKPISGYVNVFHGEGDQMRHIENVKRIAQNSNSPFVFFLSDSPMMYVFTQKLNPTRYDLPYIAGSLEKRYEILHDLKKRRPDMIMYDRSTWEVDGVSNKVRLPEVYAYILECYDLSIENGIEVYKLKK